MREMEEERSRMREHVMKGNVTKKVLIFENFAFFLEIFLKKIEIENFWNFVYRPFFWDFCFLSNFFFTFFFGFYEFF